MEQRYRATILIRMQTNNVIHNQNIMATNYPERLYIFSNEEILSDSTVH